MTGPRILTVLDTKAGGVTDVPLADVAADIRRYDIIAPADSGDAGSDPR
jgi:hypothetical protein